MSSSPQTTGPANREIIATTHVDSHGTAMAPEALEGMVAQIDAAPVRRLLEHDWTIPPDAKLIRGEIESLPDGALALYGTYSAFTLLHQTTLPDGTSALIQGTQEDRRPFVGHHPGPVDQLEVVIDRANFDNPEESASFLAEMDAIAPFAVGNVERRSAVPDPELLVVISRTMVDHWWEIVVISVLTKVGNKVVDRVGNEIAEDAVKGYRLLRSAPSALLTRSRPRGAEVTYVIVVAGTPEVQFVVRTRLPKVFEHAIRAESLHEHLATADELHAMFDATEIQFLFDKKEGWIFNFLLTRSGDVVGTTAAFGRRPKRVQMDASRLAERRGE